MDDIYNNDNILDLKTDTKPLHAVLMRVQVIHFVLSNAVLHCKNVFGCLLLVPVVFVSCLCFFWCFIDNGREGGQK